MGALQEMTIGGVEIGRDAEGRVCLNDLHKASGGDQNKKPVIWLRTQISQDLVSELKGENSHLLGEQVVTSPNNDFHDPIHTTTGRNGGTYAHELLAISYAGWISPRFQLLVNQTFLDYRLGRLRYEDDLRQRQAEASALPPSPNSPTALAELDSASAKALSAAIRVGRRLGMTPAQAAVQANATVIERYGIDWIERMDAEALLADRLASESRTAIAVRAPNPREQWIGRVRAWLTAEPQGDREMFNGAEILTGALDKDPDEITISDLTTLGLVMRELGWPKRQRRIGGDRMWLYHRPRVH